MSNAYPNLSPFSKITGYDQGGNPQITNYAPDALAISDQLNVWTFYRGADGAAHDLMFNRAIAALAATGGGVVYAPAYTYNITASIVIPSDAVTLCGDGWSTILKPTSGANFDVISTPSPTVQGTAGYIRKYVVIQDLAIDCSNMTGTTAGQGNAIHFYGVQYGSIRNVYINKAQNWGILLDGDSTNFGYWNVIERCFLNQCAGHLRMTSCEANRILNNTFNLTQNTQLAALQPAFGTQSQVAYVLYINAGYANIIGNVIKNSSPNANPALYIDNSGPCLVQANKFDTTTYEAIFLNAGGHTIVGNEIDSASNVGNVAALKLSSSGNSIVGNVFSTSGTGGGAAKWNYAIQEGGARANNMIVGNQLLTGTAGVLGLNTASTNDHVVANNNFNPQNHNVAQPAIPASGVAQTNFSSVDCTVYVAGGTVTAIAVGGVATGMTSGTIRVPAGSSITLTYSVAPTWQWFGD